MLIYQKGFDVMGLFSDWKYYDKSSGDNVLTTAQKKTIHQAYRRYAKRALKEAENRINGKYDSSSRTYDVRFSTGGFINSPEYQNLAIVKKFNIDFNHQQQEQIAKKTATLLRKDRLNVTVLNYGDVRLYRR